MQALHTFTRAECLALVEQSPAAVAAHDEAAWLSIFARDSVVEDPVGSAPHRNTPAATGAATNEKSALSRFYATFIAPNQIRFEVARDIVCSLHVMRDLTIVIAMAPAVTVRVPVHLLYELVEEGGQLRVARLAAHWELWPMLRQQLASGWPFLRVGWASSVRMLRHLGFGGMRGFSQALSGVGAAGKARVEKFAACFNRGEGAALAALCSAPDIAVQFPFGTPRTLGQCLEQGGELDVSKLLAAGAVVSATVRYTQGEQVHHGVALFQLDRSNLHIVAITFYWE